MGVFQLQLRAQHPSLTQIKTFPFGSHKKTGQALLLFVVLLLKCKHTRWPSVQFYCELPPKGRHYRKSIQDTEYWQYPSDKHHFTRGWFQETSKSTGAAKLVRGLQESVQLNVYHCFFHWVTREGQTKNAQNIGWLEKTHRNFLYDPNLNCFSWIVKVDKCHFPNQNKQGSLRSKPYKVSLYSTSLPPACSGRPTFAFLFCFVIIFIPLTNVRSNISIASSCT